MYNMIYGWEVEPGRFVVVLSILQGYRRKRKRTYRWQNALSKADVYIQGGL